MPRGNRTSLFVSSTCYDLGQVRTDIRDFAESIGFEPFLSEFDSFPVNPNQNTLSNCLNAVKNHADIFVLIVGGRYGSITDTGKSITNLEFAEADIKGIPKYVFVKEDILSLLPIWKANPDADFSSAVDTPKLFEFISSLRDSGEIWVFPFSNAQNIINTLKKQLSFLFADSLDLRSKLHESNSLLAELKPKALRIALEKPTGWEYLLFAQVLSDKISSYSRKRLDAEFGISFGEPVMLEDVQDVSSWMSSRFGWMLSTINQIDRAINDGFVKAIGEPGQPGNIERIIHLATRIAEGYGELLDWKLQFLRVSCDDEFSLLIQLASNFSSNAITEIEEFSEKLYRDIESHLTQINSNDESTVVTITLTLTMPDTTAFNEEIARINGLES